LVPNPDLSSQDPFGVPLGGSLITFPQAAVSLSLG
jgi:hypothetical protein